MTNRVHTEKLQSAQLHPEDKTEAGERRDLITAVFPDGPNKPVKIKLHDKKDPGVTTSYGELGSITTWNDGSFKQTGNDGTTVERTTDSLGGFVEIHKGPKPDQNYIDFRTVTADGKITTKNADGTGTFVQAVDKNTDTVHRWGPRATDNPADETETWGDHQLHIVDGTGNIYDSNWQNPNVTKMHTVSRGTVTDVVNDELAHTQTITTNGKSEVFSLPPR